MSVSKRIRQVVLERDGHACVRCGQYVGPFGDYSIHHRRPRGMGGTKRLDTDLPANLLTLCGSGTTGCHGWVESNRMQALATGLLIGQTQTPSAVPLETYRGPMLLDNDGCWQVAA